MKEYTAPPHPAIARPIMKTTLLGESAQINDPAIKIFG